VGVQVPSRANISIKKNLVFKGFTACGTRFFVCIFCSLGTI